MAHLLEALADRVLLCDGGTGTSIHAYALDPHKDYWGHENCTEILTRSRPDVVREVQRGYYAAGADIVETNTFGGSPITLAEFGLADQAYAINKEATELLREVTEEFAGDGRERWVIGDVGPGTKLASLGHIDYDTLEEAYVVQCAGLIDGGVDGILLLTFQDPLQLKAAANGAKRAREAAGADVPIFAQVTLETTGTMLVGTDIAAAATMIRALDVPLIGMNCATGPEHMAGHVRWLGRNWPGLIAVQPNGGLPELIDGRVCYPLSPAVLASWLERFLEEDGINLIGGCCGTNATHIAALDAMLRRRAPKGSHRPTPVRRRNHWVPALASLYRQAPIRRSDRAFLIANGCDAMASPAFRRAQEAGDWEACVAMARAEENAGCDAVALGVPESDQEIRVTAELMSRLRGALTVPLMIRSTNPAAIATALKLYGGKALIDPIGLALDDDAAAMLLALARRFGATVLARLPENDAAGDEVESQVRNARAIRNFACGQHGLAPEELLIGVQPKPIGMRDRASVRRVLELISRLAAEMPDCGTVVDLSRFSDDLPAPAARVLAHVFLTHAKKRGLAAAIMDVPGIGRALDVPEDLLLAAESLILADNGLDRLRTFTAMCAGRALETGATTARPAEIGARLRQRIVDGDRQGMENDLDEALRDHEALDIITEFLLAGMKIVGDLFGNGKIPLPHVLQSAETMKAAVAHLEPRLERAEGRHQGTIVLATVKGDIHDIGKNLVDIVLSNSGYKTVNLGSKQPLEAILAATREHRADAIGMSGLLLNSAIVMRNNLQEMARQHLTVPVLLGGAALSRRFVAENCAPAYGSGQVAYAGDVFDGLRLMEAVATGHFDQVATRAPTEQAGAEAAPEPSPELHNIAERPTDAEGIRIQRAELRAGVEIPAPPFFGAKVVELSLDELLPFLNQTMLYMFHWGYKKAGRSLEQWRAWCGGKLRPILDDLVERCRNEGIPTPCAVYGYWRCAASGNSLVLFEEDGKTEAARFSFPRQRRPGGLCIADFFRDVGSPGRDVVALQAVTVGQRASDVAREWYRADRYRDYLFLHGLAVELTEAAAEYVHKRIRGELGIAADDAVEMERLLRQGYRGARYSFGYPACPNLEDQRPLVKLLGAARIDVTMAEEGQLHPELTTCAIIAHHPQARYFSV